MADDNRGYHNDPQGHAQAGAQSSGNTDAAQNLSDENRVKGGQASAQSQNHHELTEEERSRGGQTSSSEQNMSELGKMGGSK